MTITINTTDAIPVRLDVPQIRAAFAAVRRVVRSFARSWVYVFDQLCPRSFVSRTEVHVSGLEARFMVRAGMDPAYATEAGCDGLVRAILAGDIDDVAGLRVGDRARVAAAAAAGWARHRAPSGSGLMPWHRLVGTTVVEVSRG